MTRPVWRSRYGYFAIEAHVNQYLVTVGGHTHPVALDVEELADLRDALLKEPLPRPPGPPLRRRPGPTEIKIDPPRSVTHERSEPETKPPDRRPKEA